jgi:alpha-ketoglutarate-dependent taurine dioxygenase
VLFETEALPGAFGVRVTDFDLGRGNIDEVVASILELMWEHHVVVFDQRIISAEAFERYNRTFGGAASAAQRQLCRVGSSHTDESTQFIDVMAAYEALPRDEKERIDCLRVGSYFGPIGGADHDDNTVLSFPFRIESDNEGAPTAIRPLVRRHPLTGRRSLSLPIGVGSRIVGLPHDEGVELITHLERHAQQPKFRYVHSYQPDDLMAWDSLATVDSRLPAVASRRAGLLRAFGPSPR